MVITLASCCLVFAGCGNKNPTVTLDKRNGEPIDTIQMQSQHCYWQYGAADFPAPSRSGYFFAGWFTDFACIRSVHGMTIDKDVAFYAC